MKRFKDFAESKKKNESPANATGPAIADKDIPFFDKALKRDKFRGMKVFDVTPEDFGKARLGKAKFERMKRFFDNINDGIGREIHDFSKKFPKQGIIVRNEKTNSMMILKQSKK